MSRLVAFGCSLTQGQGLENMDYNYYSKLSWPYRLADKMNLECINAAVNGSSAKRMWYHILNFDFQPTDTVVILWTHMDRWCVITEEMLLTNTQPMTDWDIYPDDKERYRVRTGQLNITPSRDDELMEMWYGNFHNELDMTLQYYLHVNHAHEWLKDRVKNVYHLKASETERVAFFNNVSFLKTDLNSFRHDYPYAMDNAHPGKECMEEFANRIYNEINLIVN